MLSRWGSRLALLLVAIGVIAPIAQDQSSPPYRRYTANSSLPTNLTKAVVQDEAGRLWVGTDNGLVRFDGSEFTTYRQPLRSPFVKDVYSVSDRRLLVVTDRGIQEVTQQRDSVSFSLVVAGRDPQTDSTVTYPKSVYRDQDGRLWIAESNAIVRYEDGMLTRYVPDLDLSYWSERFMRSFLFADLGDGPLVATAQRGYAFPFDAEADRFRRIPLPDRPEAFFINALWFHP